MPFEIRKLSPSDAQAFLDIRLTALQQSPAAFIMDVLEEEKETPYSILPRICNEKPLAEAFVFGAFAREQDKEKLVGISAFEREKWYKLHHKGTIWGVYVLPDYRQHGIARQLMQKTIASAKKIRELEQINIEVSGNFQQKFYESLGFSIWGIEQNGTKIGKNYFTWTHMVLNLKQ